jgi:7,8-dihydropterin-6-yl-methyl-4-(beta-D-ribofuranosyl)aminobenzene 5'-phosphate synthase
LKEFGVRYLLGAHCTGVETVFQLRSIVGLTRADAVVGAVGSTFILGRGIDALALAR